MALGFQAAEPQSPLACTLDVSSEIQAHFAQDRLLMALRVVESLPAAARGALLVGPAEDPLGTILIDNNRVCWSAAPGMSQRLRDILQSHCSGNCGADLDSVCERCRREHRALEDELVVSGLLTGDHLREALKQHTIESLLAVDSAVPPAAAEWPMRWVEHAGAGYRPRHTFGTLELLGAAGALRLDELAATQTGAHLEALAGPDTALVAFSFLTDGTPLYLSASTGVPLDLQDLVELAAWAEAALGASQGFSPAVARACVQAAEGGSAVAWRHGDQSCAALCVDGNALRRLSSALIDEARAMVLSARCSVLERARMRLGRSYRPPPGP